MALAAVLSAVRELILETDRIPEDEFGRRAEYRERFPALSPLEIEDLAKIVPQKIRTYTSTIFNGEKNILRDLFSGTIALLKSQWKKCYGTPFDLFEFTKDLNRKCPWHGNATVVLAEGLVRYIQEHRPEIVREAPEILDIMKFELFSMKIRRLAEARHEQVLSSRDSLSKLTVAELMALRFKLNPPYAFVRFDHNVIGELQSYYRDDFFPAVLERRPQYSVVSRNSHNRLRWRELSAQLFEFLNSIGPSESRTLEELALVFAALNPTLPSEQELFTGFITLILGLMDDGVVVVIH